ncbi:MAG: hypothetical protein JWR58_3221 [Pseudonocardia sp.]|nr:hypothetical protein [Pseudonocardia sp.]
MTTTAGVPSARPSRAGRAVTAAGVLVMLVAAVVAGRYTPLWLDPDEGCTVLGRCATAESAELLRAMWWVVGGGFTVVLAGRVLRWRRLPRGPRSAARFPLPPWGQAGAAGLVGLVFCVVVGPVVLIALLISAQGIPTALCVLWLLQARAVTALDRATGPARRSLRVEWLIGLVASAVAVAVVVAVSLIDPGPFTSSPYLIADGGALAAVVLLARVLFARGEQSRGTGSVRHMPGAGIAALAVASLVALAVPWPGPADEPAAAGQQLYAGAPPPSAEPASPAAVPPPAPVDAATPCLPGDLTWSTTGWDAAMGTRAVTVVATQHGRHPCCLDGFADVTLAQGGRPLRLVVVPGSVTEPGQPPSAQRVGVAPGGSASFVLFWKAYGAAADQDAPQALGVALSGTADQADVPLSEGPAPFDVVEGATVQIGAWQPAA